MSILKFLKSNKIKWLSVPPVIKSIPNLLNSLAKCLLFSIIYYANSLNDYVLASFNATAIAVIEWKCAPATNPGATDSSI